MSEQQNKPTVVSARSGRCAYIDAETGQCKKKTGLTANKCRCDKTFCPKHRLPEKHNCSYDFRSHHLAEMTTLVGDMKCVASKLTEA
jgi:predicted nucleic acid binding AN1-type Zn finger protein